MKNSLNKELMKRYGIGILWRDSVVLLGAAANENNIIHTGIRVFGKKISKNIPVSSSLGLAELQCLEKKYKKKN